MNGTKVWLPAASLALSVAAIGCDITPQPALVQYGDSTPIGQWAPAAAGRSASASASSMSGASAAGAYGNAAGPTGVLQPDDTGHGNVAGATAAAGSGAMMSGAAGAKPPTGGVTGGSSLGKGGSSAAGSGGAMAVGSGGSASSAGGTGGAGGMVSTPPSTLSSLTFDVTTSPVGYQYQPRNIGAIWVQDSAGKLVKSLEVWASIRRRYLTNYSSALAGASVDVTASATLNTHRTHHASWDLRDKTGAAVPPGRYTLVTELTDGDATGRTNSVSFDTSAGATTLSPADAPSFAGMKLQLQ